MKNQESIAHELLTIYTSLQSAMNYFEKKTDADKRFVKLGKNAIERLKAICDDLAEDQKREGK